MAVVTPMRSIQLKMAVSSVFTSLPSGPTGSSCMWMSMKPGATTFPAASTTWSASGSAAVTAATFPSASSRFSRDWTRFMGSMTRPFLISVFIVWDSVLSGGLPGREQPQNFYSC